MDISSGFVANSLLVCIAYIFVWSQICFRSSFRLVVASNISNAVSFSEMSNKTLASGMRYFTLTNLDVSFHFNSVTFVLSVWLVAHLYPRLYLQQVLLLLVLEVDGFLLYCPEKALLLSIPCKNILKDFQCYCQSQFQFCRALQIFHCCQFRDLYVYTSFCYLFPF